jgi:hypothetical protein
MAGNGGGGSGGASYGVVRNAGSTLNRTGGSVMGGTGGAAGTAPGANGQPGGQGVQLTF